MPGKKTPGNMAQTLGTEGHLSGQEDEPLGECRWARHLCLLRCVDVTLNTSHQVSFGHSGVSMQQPSRWGLAVGVSTEQLSFLVSSVLSAKNHAE